LLDANADIQSISWANAKSTPLLAATCGHHEKTVERLLARGADPNKADGEGYAPLVYAACASQTGIAEMLLKHGANADATGGGGTPALGFAAAAEDVDMIKILVRYGARIDVKDDADNDVLQAAHKMGHVGAAAIIVECARERDSRLKLEFDAAINAMAAGTVAPLTLRRPLRLKAGIS
jgi:ankyrin repeat protein